jgi:hypothetical protein
MKIEDTETNTEEPILEGQEEAEVTEGGEEQSTETGEQALVAEDDGNEVVVSIGEPDPQAEEERKAPQWVRDLRKTNRELLREKKELEARLNTQTTETKPVQVGAKPRIEDFDYDAEKFEGALTDWFEKKRRADQEEQRRKDEAKAQDEAWQAKLDNYGKLKAEIPVKDFQEAEAEVKTALSVVQQGIVLQGAENPALVVYALGKNPTKAKELAALTDPVKFAFAVAKMEAQLKVTPKKPTPEPERVVNGTGRISGTVDSELERLREAASKSNDYSKVRAYQRQKQSK